MARKKIVFVTGTDTGVGKTLLTATLLYYLRQNSVRALAMKPFCSGGLADVRLIQALQPGELSDAEANPFYFEEPIAPLVASARSKKITLAAVLRHIHAVAEKCDYLIIEGSGGLLVPLGKNYTVADLIAHLDCDVLVAAHNKLGTINHTWLTINVLNSYINKLQKGEIAKNEAPRKISVVLMHPGNPDLSTQTNEKTLLTLLKPIQVVGFPFLGKKASTSKSVKENYSKLRAIVAKL